MEDEQQENSKVPPQLQPHVFKKGQSGNPNGRPLGSISLKQYAKAMLEEMNDEQRQEFLQGLPKNFIWEMAEGKADTKSVVKATIDVNNLSELPDDELDRIISGSTETKS